jgi:hypothetical protein
MVAQTVLFVCMILVLKKVYLFVILISRGFPQIFHTDFRRFKLASLIFGDTFEKNEKDMNLRKSA